MDHTDTQENSELWHKPQQVMLSSQKLHLTLIAPRMICSKIPKGIGKEQGLTQLR